VSSLQKLHRHLRDLGIATSLDILRESPHTGEKSFCISCGRQALAARVRLVRVVLLRPFGTMPPLLQIGFECALGTARSSLP
jgi:hypothetical protein